MSESRRPEEQIAEAVRKFHAKAMSIVPEALTVDMHESSVVVTLTGIACPAEKDLAADEEARELLERFHRRAFEAAKQSLDAEVGRLAGRPVKRSRLNVDPQTGDSVILFVLAPESRREEDSTDNE